MGSRRHALPPGERSASLRSQAADVKHIHRLQVTGKYPFEDPQHPNSVAHTLRRIRDGTIRPLPLQVSPDCVSLIYALLAPQPERRPGPADALQHKWIRRHRANATAKGAGPVVPQRPTTTPSALHQHAVMSTAVGDTPRPTSAARIGFLQGLFGTTRR